MPAASSSLPGSRTPRTEPVRRGRFRASPCLALLRVGFTEPAESPRPLVRSYRTVSPLPASGRRNARQRRFAFCCTFPGLAAGRRYRPPCPVEPGLSSRQSAAKAARQPTVAPPAPRPAPRNLAAPPPIVEIRGRLRRSSMITLPAERPRHPQEPARLRQESLRPPWALAATNHVPPTHLRPDCRAFRRR